MHRMKMDHFDDRGLLGVEYEFEIEFGFAEAEPGDRINPPIPAHPYDERIVSAKVWFGGKRFVINSNVYVNELSCLNKMLSPGAWPEGPLRVASQEFLDSVHEAIAEHLKTERESARESAAEAKFQAMRDGE